MSWWVRVVDSWRDTDDLTVDEIVAIEAVAGEPWAFLSPMGSAPVAKALMAAFLVRDGMDDVEATAKISAMTLREIKNCFRYYEDADLPDNWEDGLPVVDPKAGSSTSTAT